jgi:hypothetical protein
MNSIHITDNNDCFLSKNSKLRLKADIKKNTSDNLESCKYLKSGFILSVDKTENDVYIKTSPDTSKDKQQNKVNLKLKLQELRKMRTNIIGKSLNVMSKEGNNELVELYKDVIKTSKRLNVPEPYEVLNHPNIYKSVIDEFLNVRNQMGIASDNVPILKYYIALANKLGIDTTLKPSNINMDQIMNLGYTDKLKEELNEKIDENLDEKIEEINA